MLENFLCYFISCNTIIFLYIFLQNRKELKSLMSQLDIDGNGELNLAEFARAMTTSYRLNSLNLQVNSLIIFIF